MSTVYLSLGSNLGDRQQNLNFAMAEIGRRCGKIEACSSFYSTSPWGFESSNEFINLALALTTTLEPVALLAVLKAIEAEAGRQQKQQAGYEDRPLDIDILFYDDMILECEPLSIPHPRLHLRLFVLVPLCEIAPGFIHPSLHQSIETLLQFCPDTNSIHVVHFS